MGLPALETDKVVLEGFSTKAVSEKSGRDIFSKLMEDLESLSMKTVGEGSNTLFGEETLQKSSHPENQSDKESLVPSLKCDHCSSKAGLGSSFCLSQNGFQVLQDIREEGEIEKDDRVEEVIYEDLEVVNKEVNVLEVVLPRKL